MIILALFANLTIGNDSFEKLATAKDPNSRIRAIESVRPQKNLAMARLILPLLGDPHPKVRLRAVRALVGLKDPAGVNLVMSYGLRDSRARTREGSCIVLGKLGQHRFFDALLRRLSDRNPDVRGAAATALVRLNHPRTEDFLLPAFKRDRHPPLRVAVLDAIGETHPELLDQAQSDRHYEIRLAAAEIRPTRALLNDRDWRVRAATIEACLNLRRAEFVGWLIERLPREEGRLRWDVWSALRDLAGRDLGPGAEAWQDWWSAVGDRFTVPAPGAAGVNGVSTQASFFDLPILSTRILFVLDLSGSMRDLAPGGKGTKLDAAKAGMVKTIRALSPKTRFGITGLGCAADGSELDPAGKTWQRLRLLPAAPQIRANAERFVGRLEAKGWTNLYDGILNAFRNPDVDTIYLYSDGGASKGTFVAAGEIVRQIERLNRFRRIVIHTVEVPGASNTSRNRRLLSRLAAVTGGTCRLSGAK